MKKFCLRIASEPKLAYLWGILTGIAISLLVYELFLVYYVRLAKQMLGSY